MSFQGDVRGIGLAELLQGLARGRKEGVLTLTAKSGLRSNLGLEGGKVSLLPEEGEDSERWRARARDSYPDELNARADHLRMTDIARAVRMEQLYALLDGGGVHFRFEPGILPNADTKNIDGQSAVYCDGIQVEFLLLEYARIADELGKAEGALDLPDDVVPCVMDPSVCTETPPRLYEQCDGRSTVLEIADRLGWPARQAKLMLCLPLERGAVRLATPSEVLNLALVELAAKNFSRAANRLSAWARDGQPGPVASVEAEKLANEWVAGRLLAALKGMVPSRVRTLLRRLDHALQNPSLSVVHWIEVSRIYRTDRIARMKRMVAEFREGSNPERPSVRELLDLSREFRDAGHPARSAPLLVIAAHLQPQAVGQRLELGLGLVTAGRIEEGSPWVVAGARTLLDAHQADRAVAPLRTLLQSDPRNRECRQLLARARRSSTHARKLRKHLLVSLAVVSVFSAAAVVKLRQDKVFQDRLAEVRSLIATPTVATAKLQQVFPDQSDLEVRALRDEIEDRQRVNEIEQRNAWLDKFSEALVECNRGDPARGFQMCIELEDPPKLLLLREPWPLRSDMFGALAQHLAEELDLLGPPIEGSPQQLQREQLLSDQIAHLLAEVEKITDSRDDFTDFVASLKVVQGGIEERQDRRDDLIKERLAHENGQEQERLYLTAEAHAKNGDFERALRNYEDILERDTEGRLRPVLQPRMDDVRKKHEAVQKARKLSKNGEHDRAWDVLQATFENPSSFMLPWNVATVPAGATVEFSNGRIYRTPFDIESTFGEALEMTITLKGFETTRITTDRPGDVFSYLSRTPDRAWGENGRVDAVPVGVDSDHIVADRKGNLARIGPGGGIMWKTEIRDLSGVARAPVFMPDRPGSLLIVTEGGAAWILDSNDGRLEGPQDLGSTPRIGPAPSPNGGKVQVHLANNTSAVWESGLKPSLSGPGAASEFGADGRYRFGSDAGLQVLRSRGHSETELACQWNDWTVEIGEDVYKVYREGQPEEAYPIRREGKWGYVAWESATVHAPLGRLWISDGAGVRAFVPPPTGN